MSHDYMFPHLRRQADRHHVLAAMPKVASEDGNATDLRFPGKDKRELKPMRMTRWRSWRASERTQWSWFGLAGFVWLCLVVCFGRPDRDNSSTSSSDPHGIGPSERRSGKSRSHRASTLTTAPRSERLEMELDV